MHDVHTVGLPEQVDDGGELAVRFTVRLPSDLLGWVRQQGGSSYVRFLLAQQRVTGNGSADTGRSLRPSSLRDQWQQLANERESLEDERAILKDEERVLDRHRSRLDTERALLDDRREQLEDEWSELEKVREELEGREKLLAGLFRPALVPLDLIDLRLLGGRRV
jgi:DNA repair exonuclease SbcCD ATPase subunit